MSGQIKIANGTVGAPAITFGRDADTGIYRKTEDLIGLVAGGVEIASIDFERSDPGAREVDKRRLGQRESTYKSKRHH